MTPEHLTYTHIGKTPIELSIYLGNKSNQQKKPTIYYIHGGGLIYGSRHDLPKEYIELLTSNGSDVVMLDYPLLPESTLDIILNTLTSGIEFARHYLHQENQPYLLFGRSAGAYLSLLLSNKYLTPKPIGVISFYGYFDLSEMSLQQPSQHYNQYGLLPDMLVQNFIQKDILANAPIEQRFPIYLSYRQRGTWVKQLLAPNLTLEDYSLDEDALASLPKLFIAASDTDQDVDISISKSLYEQTNHSTFVTVHDLSHDFDKNPKDSQAIRVYQDLKTWINDL